MCRRMAIKKEIKEELMDDGVTVKQEQTSIKHEPDAGGDTFHDEPSTSQASPSRASPSSNSMYMQKRFELLTSERNSLKQELEKLKKELSEQNQGLSVNQLSEKLEDSWQKIEDLESQLNKATSQGNILRKELELLRVSQNVNANEALSKSLAQLKAAQEERDMLSESKADLERRVNQFTKTLKEKLDVQSREIEEDYNKKLRAARERAASAEVKADNLKEEKKSMLLEMTRVYQRLREEEQQHKNAKEKANQAREKSCKEMEVCKTKVQAVLEANCKELEEKTSAWKTRLQEMQRSKDDLLEEVKKSEDKLVEVKGKHQALVKKQEEMDKVMKEGKEKEAKAVKALDEVEQRHGRQIKEVEEEGNKRLEQCRQELQVSQDLVICNCIPLIPLKFDTYGMK